MLDLYRLAAQLPDFSQHRAGERARAASLLERALACLESCDGCWEDLRERAARADVSWLVARLRERPAGRHAPEPRPTPVTVVATDGSQVFPDRHREPHCYLLNVSRLAFQYGTHEAPFIEAVPMLGYEQKLMENLLDEIHHDASDEAISARRDELELAALLDTARSARVEGRPLVAVADGTLIRWMLRAMRDAKQAEGFVQRYAALLEGFRAERLPLCSYVSLPRNTEVTNLLRIHVGEGDTPGGDAGGDAVPAAAEASLEGLLDRAIFERTLLPGERSAIFESSSKIQMKYAPDDRICYFYLHVPGGALGEGGEIARVELPTWVADDAGLVALVHSVVLSECDKGGGYPMILAEAHERAVIRQREKDAFFALLDHSLSGPGQPPMLSRKASSKRTPMG